MANPKEGRKVSIEEARQLCIDNPVIDVLWRPEASLPESEQYAVVFGGTE